MPPCRHLPVLELQTAKKPYSMDENMFHISYEAGILEDPAASPPEDMFRLTVDPRKAPDTPAHLKVTFEQGIPVAVENAADGKRESPCSMCWLCSPSP